MVKWGNERRDRGCERGLTIRGKKRKADKTSKKDGRDGIEVNKDGGDTAPGGRTVTYSLRI